MSRVDRIVIAVIAALALVVWPLAALAAGGADTAVITSPTGVTRISLEDDAILAVAGALSPVVVEVAKGAVRVAESECPDLICVHTGWISSPGAVIACVPNHVVVRIEGTADDGLDARVR